MRQFFTHLFMPKSQQIIEHTSTTIIVALSDTEIGKVLLPNTFQFVGVNTGEVISNLFGTDPTLEGEIEALKYANAINDLMPTFIRKETWQADDHKEYDMIVMERLHPLPIHHFDVSVRRTMIECFEENLKQLHDHHFVHGDLIRPTNYFTRDDKEWMFRNIVQTESGLRLIDTGFAKILGHDNVKLFVSTLIRERTEIDDFRAFYLSG